MTGEPSRRLLDAAATLDPGDRALLNLWLHRGLDDERLAALTGMTADAVRHRRERMLGALSSELGLPERDVADALRTLGADGADGTTEPRDATPPPPVEAAQPATSRRRGRVWLAITAAVALVAAAVLVIVVSHGGSARRVAAVTEPSAALTTAPATSTAARSGTRVQALLALPGGPRHASGIVRLLGHGRALKLRLTVRGLPTLRHGHYEAWLYNSVLDSRALGRVRSRRTETYRLPRDAHRYTAIDVSYQPRGSVNESGESRLRALDPAHDARRHHHRRGSDSRTRRTR